MGTETYLSLLSQIQRGKKGTTTFHFSLLTSQIKSESPNNFHHSLFLSWVLLCMAIAAAAVVVPLGLLFFASGLLVNLIQVSLFPFSLHISLLFSSLLFLSRMYRKSLSSCKYLRALSYLIHHFSTDGGEEVFPTYHNCEMITHTVFCTLLETFLIIGSSHKLYWVLCLESHIEKISYFIVRSFGAVPSNELVFWVQFSSPWVLTFHF